MHLSGNQVKNWETLIKNGIKSACFYSKKVVSETISFLPKAYIYIPCAPTKICAGLRQVFVFL